MADSLELLGHLLVLGRAEDRDFRRRGGGRSDVQAVDRQVHGERILREVDLALDDRASPPELARAQLEALGTIITIEGAGEFQLQLGRLDQHTRHRTDPRPKWLLLSVRPSSTDSPG